MAPQKQCVAGAKRHYLISSAGSSFSYKGVTVVSYRQCRNITQNSYDVVGPPNQWVPEEFQFPLKLLLHHNNRLLSAAGAHKVNKKPF